MKYSTKEAYEQIKKFPIVFAALIVELFLMINGSYLFQAPSIYSTTQIEIFVLTIAVFSLLSGYTIENGLNFETFKTFKYFVPSFPFWKCRNIWFLELRQVSDRQEIHKVNLQDCSSKRRSREYQRQLPGLSQWLHCRLQLFSIPLML